MQDRAVEGLRERKKRRTRRALADAALRLFTEQGYEHTTIAQIAATADVSPRTFFGYFRSKEDVLFGDTDERIDLLREAITHTPPGSSATDVLRDAIAAMFSSSAGVFGPDRQARIRLALSRPELRAKALERMLTAQRELAQWLRTTDPERLDDTSAHAVAGALVGGLLGAALVCVHRDDPLDQLHAQLRRTLDVLEPILSPSGRPARQV